MNNNIETERWKMQISKEDISKKLGISSKTYLAYTRGKAIPSSVLIKMAQLFGVTTDYLLGIAPRSGDKKGA